MGVNIQHIKFGGKYSTYKIFKNVSNIDSLKVKDIKRYSMQKLIEGKLEWLLISDDVNSRTMKIDVIECGHLHNKKRACLSRRHNKS